MRLHPFPLLILSLVACRPEPAQEAPIEVNNASEPAGPPLPEADINASLEPIAGNGNSNGADGAEGPPRFVGRWATTRDLCGRREWRITENELRTAEGRVCRFTDVREVDGGYDVAARCTADGPERDDTLQMRFSSVGILIESESLITVGMFRCPD